MRILTLNCQRAMQPGLGRYLRGVLASRHYDFILLQEVDRKVRRLLVHSEYIVMDSLHPEGTEFLILHKRSYRLQSREFISFQHFGRVKTEVGALIGIFTKGGQRYSVCNAHLHWGRYLLQRRKALSAIRERLMALPGIRILGGDLNTILYREDLAAARILERFRRAEYEGHTHDSLYLDATYLFGLFTHAARAGLRFRSSIDHIYVHGAQIRGAKVHPVLVSDHRPLEAEILLRQEKLYKQEPEARKYNSAR